MSSVSSACVRLGAVWSKDSPNNEWRDLAAQLLCGYNGSSRSRFLLSSSGSTFSALRGDCEDLVLLTVGLFFESGWAASPPFTGALSDRSVEWVAAVACVVETEGHLSSCGGGTSGRSGGRLFRGVKTTAHMCLGVKFEEDPAMYLGDCTAKSLEWRWGGRVYWATTLPRDGSRGTTLFFGDRGRAAPDGVSGQTILPGGRVLCVPPAESAACCVDILTTEAGREQYDAALAFERDFWGLSDPGGGAE